MSKKATDRLPRAEPRPTYAHAVRALVHVGSQVLNLAEFDLAVLAPIVFDQPISRDALKYILRHEIISDLIDLLAAVKPDLDLPARAKARRALCILSPPSSS
jgi:hypothetical protein